MLPRAVFPRFGRTGHRWRLIVARIISGYEEFNGNACLVGAARKISIIPGYLAETLRECITGRRAAYAFMPNGFDVVRAMIGGHIVTLASDDISTAAPSCPLITYYHALQGAFSVISLSTWIMTGRPSKQRPSFAMEVLPPPTTLPGSSWEDPGLK